MARVEKVVVFIQEQGAFFPLLILIHFIVCLFCIWEYCYVNEIIEIIATTTITITEIAFIQHVLFWALLGILYIINPICLCKNTVSRKWRLVG